MTVGQRFDCPTNSLTMTHVKEKYLYILIVGGQMEQPS
jgi:hypothetical protein